MDRFRELEVFVATAEAGSLAGAARRLRMSPPAVTRAVAALEERLGASLMVRTTRRLALTEGGRHFLESARRILADLAEAELAAVGETAVPQGHLRITSSVTFGRAVLGPVVRAFLDENRGVTVSALLLDRPVNLIEEGLDLAVRIGPLPDSGLVARRVGTVRRLLVASPAYLSAAGVPEQPAALGRHRFIAFTGLMPTHEWRYRDGSQTKAVPVRPALEFNDALAAIETAEAGGGITVVYSYMVSDALRAGRLATVLDAFRPEPLPVSLIYPAARMIAPKTRAFIDFAAPRLKDYLSRLPP